MVSGTQLLAAPVGRPRSEGVVIAEYIKMLLVFDMSLKWACGLNASRYEISLTAQRIWSQAKTIRSRNDV
jgi:hypothetical protein